MRIFASLYPCYLDPSNGAATSVRDLLIALAARGHRCRVLCGPMLDVRRRASDLVALKQLPARRGRGPASSRHSIFEFVDRGIEASMFVPDGTSRYPVEGEHGGAFIAHHRRILEAFQPDVMLSYGYSWLEKRLFATAKEAGVPVVFVLCNSGYKDAAFFEGLHPMTCSRALADHYRSTIGLDSTPIHPLVDAERVLAETREPKYLTFVSPLPLKGSSIVARIVHDLAERRPDIPVLVVQGRGKFDFLGKAGLDLTRARNLHAMYTAPHAKDFYGLTRVLLMPSLKEAFGMVAVEAMANGIPVLASRRGGLSEALEHGGFLFDLAPRNDGHDTEAPSSEEVAPWLSTIERLWDDAAFYEAESARAKLAASRFDTSALAPAYEDFFARVAGGRRDAQRPAPASWLLSEVVATEPLPPPPRREKATVRSLHFERRNVGA